MYRICTTEKTTNQQRQFETTLLDMLQAQTYESISISELCREAGMSRKTFYRLFDAKADVLFALVDHTLLDYQKYEQDATVGPGGLHRCFAFWREQKPLLDALDSNGVISLLMDRSIRLISTEDADLVHILGADEENAFETLLFSINAIYSLIFYWHSTGYEKSIDEMSALMMKLLTTPIVKRPLAPDPSDLPGWK